MFQVLYAEAYEPGAFKKKWAEVADNNNMPINPDADNGTYTFLQYCCDQVWTITQFYSVDFSQSRVTVNKCVYNKAQAQSRFASVDFDSDLERPCQA